MKIVLIGFMGSGKSTSATHLSKLLQWQSFDLDEELLKRSEYSSISKIFSQRGEAYFRDLETQTLSLFQKQNEVILATGGGIVERSENIEILHQSNAKVIYLETSFEQLEKRLQGDRSRPLFQDQKAAHKLYQRRQKAYQNAAHLTIQTNDLSPIQVAEKISRKLLSSLLSLQGNSQEEKNVLFLQKKPSKINAKTQVCIIIGNPVSHSLSPAMHNAAYCANKLDHEFVFIAAQIQAKQLGDWLKGFRAAQFRGLTCTIPHKQTIIPFLDQLDPIAKQIGAVNTVVQENNRLIGYNTDWIGIVKPLLKRTELQNKQVVILGAGGTARAAAFGLLQHTKQLTILNRSLKKAESLAKELNCQAGSLEDQEVIKTADILINTTPVGMQPNTTESPISKDLLKPHHLVLDAIYTPFQTQLLQDALSQGAKVISGAEMFLEQGIAQYEKYTQQKAPRQVMEQVICKQLGIKTIDSGSSFAH